MATLPARRTRVLRRGRSKASSLRLVRLVAHTGTRSNPCRARKGALKEVALRGLRPRTQQEMTARGDLVAHTGVPANPVELTSAVRALARLLISHWLRLRPPREE